MGPSLNEENFGSAGEDQAEDASGEASTKPWKHKMCLLVFGPKCPKDFEPIQAMKNSPVAYRL